MKKEELLDAVGEIDDKYVAEAEQYNSIGQNEKRVSNRRWRRWVPMAAGLCVLMIGGFVWSMQDNFKSSTSSASGTSGSSVDGGVNSEETQDTIESATVDYSEIFKSCASSSSMAEIDYTLEAGGPYYRYESADTLWQRFRNCLKSKDLRIFLLLPPPVRQIERELK